MKCILLILSVLISISGFGQTATDSTHRSTELAIENVEFNSAGVTLAGTVFKPQCPSYAAVVLVHGSGQETRMVEMASLLARNGIAVLTYDKRGVGNSGGVYAGPEVGTNNIDAANLNLLASDASAAANALLTNLSVSHKAPLGLMGFSQAGWIIPITAGKNHKISFMVLFSGPVVTTPQQLRFQFYTQGNASFWETHTEAEAREHIRSDADRYRFTSTDPRDALARLRVPGLWLFGGKDIQIPVHLSIEHLDSLRSQGKPYEYRLFPQLGHNTAFSNSPEPLDVAIKWIRTISSRMN